MTEIYTAEYLTQHLQVTDSALSFVQATPRLLPGETEDDFYRLFEMVATETLPDTDFEWLWTIDLTWLWFEVSRYRRWKNAVLSTSRRAAIEDALAKSDPNAPEIGGMNPMIRAQSRMDAEALRLGTNKCDRLNSRLAEHGYDAEAINAAAFVQALAPLTAIDKFLTSARHQIRIMMREVRSHREFAERANKVAQRLRAELEKEAESDLAEQNTEVKAA